MTLHERLERFGPKANQNLADLTAGEVATKFRMLMACGGICEEEPGSVNQFLVWNWPRRRRHHWLWVFNVAVKGREQSYTNGQTRTKRPGIMVGSKDVVPERRINTMKEWLGRMRIGYLEIAQVVEEALFRAHPPKEVVSRVRLIVSIGEHPEIWREVVDGHRLPPDFEVACQRPAIGVELVEWEPPWDEIYAESLCPYCFTLLPEDGLQMCPYCEEVLDEIEDDGEDQEEPLATPPSPERKTRRRRRRSARYRQIKLFSPAPEIPETE